MTYLQEGINRMEKALKAVIFYFFDYGWVQQRRNISQVIYVSFCNLP
jgi:hypothetical protein